MLTKFIKFALFLNLFWIISTPVFSQIKCDGKQLFTEKKCLGDELNPQEKELYRIINEYRKQNNLAPIPLSEQLSIVANRHILDLILNGQGLTHGWSNCPFDIKNDSTWSCVFDAPKRLNVNYNGKGYENLYRTTQGTANPTAALEAWKKSSLHNSIILNLDSWRSTKYDGIGLAIYEQYAAVWFGSPSNLNDGVKNSDQKGLGVTFEKAIEGLDDFFTIRKASSSVQSEQWTGISSDNTVSLEVVGTEEDVSRAAISIKIRLDKNAVITQQNRAVLSIFLKNLIPEFKEREVWANIAIENLRGNRKVPQIISQGNKMIVTTVDAQNYLVVTIKPKPSAKEIQ